MNARFQPPSVRQRGQVAQAMNAVQQFKPDHGEYRGAIRCTKCGSSLNFCVASNGLSRGQCAATGCLRWCN
jgi:hypothetical protein